MNKAILGNRVSYAHALSHVEEAWVTSCETQSNECHNRKTKN